MDIKLFVDAPVQALTIHQIKHSFREDWKQRARRSGAALRRGMIMKNLLSTLAIVLAMGGHADAQVVRPAPTNDKDQAWTNAVDYAMKKGAIDNNGQPAFKRKCHASAMQCTNVLGYYNEERKIVTLITTSDLTGQMIARHICIQNDFNDVRSCVNFDTMARSVDVKEGDEWKMAAGSR